MTDPTQALTSFQQALRRGEISLQPGILDPNVYVHADEPNGRPRLTYVTLDGTTVTAFVTFVLSDPVEGSPCFQIGYAVPEVYRNQGRAKALVQAAIAEMQRGFSQHGTFYVEAIVDAENMVSRRVAEQMISNSSVAVTDHFSGLAAFQYIRKV